MFRSHQFTAPCLSLIALCSTAPAATLEARPRADVSATARSTRANSADEVVTELRPFTHIANLPEGADLSSLKFNGIKMVKVATEQRLRMKLREGNQPWSDPGGSMYCPRVTDESPVSAYQVSYSFQGQPMVSDEYGRTDFSFSVYFRPSEISPDLLRALSSRRIHPTAAAEFLRFTMSRNTIRQVVIDRANSTFCEGYYADGTWSHTNPRCQDSITYTTTTSLAPYITVRVDPASSQVEAVAALRETSRK